MQIPRIALSAAFVGALSTGAAYAQDAAPDAAAAAADPYLYVFNTLLFFLGGILVMWMAAGFCKGPGSRCPSPIMTRSRCATTARSI